MSYTKKYTYISILLIMHMLIISIAAQDIALTSNQEQEIQVDEFLHSLGLSQEQINTITRNQDIAFIPLDEEYTNLVKTIRPYLTSNSNQENQLAYFNSLCQYVDKEEKIVPLDLLTASLIEANQKIEHLAQTHKSLQVSQELQTIAYKLTYQLEELKQFQEKFADSKHITKNQRCHKKCIDRDTYIAGSLKVSNHLNVCGNICLNGRLYVRGISQFGSVNTSDLTTSALTVNGPTIIRGSLTANAMFIDTSIVPNSLTVNGTIFSKGLQVNGPAEFTSSVSATDTFTANNITASSITTDSLIGQSNLVFNATGSNALNATGAIVPFTKIVSGKVDSSGVILAGEGFTALSTDSNEITITLVSPFIISPVIISSPENTPANITIANVTTNSFTITASDATILNFIAIGIIN